MTPHHGGYYSVDGSAPTYFDDPNPVLFLSTAGQFCIDLSCEDTRETGAEWTRLAFQIIKEALECRGIGGKTSSGYGRMKLLGSQSFFVGEGKAQDEKEASQIKTTEVTMTGINKKGNQQFKTKDGGIRCVFLPGEIIEPEMQKGETRMFWLVQERQGQEYIITSKKPG